MRLIERFNKDNNEWEEIEFKSLVSGDIFRIFDNGERYVNPADGNNVWFATSKPYMNEDQVLVIDTLY